jgi:hypothetical protein
MQQITLEQANMLATKDARALAQEIRWCQGDWIRENASRIADIETKRSDKTLYGEWKKGWKKEMLRASTEKAKSDLLARFLRDKCKQLDGAIWLDDWQTIQELAEIKSNQPRKKSTST